MEALVQIVSHIPVWVTLVLLYGIFMGVRALFPRNVSLVAVTIVPLIFLALSLSSLASAIHQVPVSAAVWVGGIAIGILGGLTLFAARILDANAGAGRLRIAGSPVTLVLFVLIFATKFYYNMHLAMDPSAAHSVGFVSAVLGLSGMSTGIMIGRVGKLLAGRFGRGSYASAS